MHAVASPGAAQVVVLVASLSAEACDAVNGLCIISPRSSSCKSRRPSHALYMLGRVSKCI